MYKQYCSKVSWVLTRYSILETIENGGSRMEAQVLSIKDQESGIKTLEELFKDLELQYWENNLIIAGKTIAKDKALDKQLFFTCPVLVLKILNKACITFTSKKLNFGTHELWAYKCWLQGSRYATWAKILKVIEYGGSRIKVQGTVNLPLSDTVH